MTIKNGIWEIFGGKTDDDTKYEKSMRLYTTWSQPSPHNFKTKIISKKRKN